MAAEQTTGASEGYQAALDAARGGKNVFLVLLALALLVQLVAGGCVVFGGVLDGLHVLSAEGGGHAGAWRAGLDLALSLSKYVAPALAVLLAVSLLVAANVALVGRLGGPAGMIGAFFWAVILAALVTPWQNIFGTDRAIGALYSLAELRTWAWPLRAAWWPAAAPPTPIVEQVGCYARLLGYPALALLVLIVLQVKFARSCRRLDRPEVVLPPRPGAPAPPAEPPTQA